MYSLCIWMLCVRFIDVLLLHIWRLYNLALPEHSDSEFRILSTFVFATFWYTPELSPSGNHLSPDLVNNVCAPRSLTQDCSGSNEMATIEEELITVFYGHNVAGPFHSAFSLPYTRLPSNLHVMPFANPCDSPDANTLYSVKLQRTSSYSAERNWRGAHRARDRWWLHVLLRLWNEFSLPLKGALKAEGTGSGQVANCKKNSKLLITKNNSFFGWWIGPHTRSVVTRNLRPNWSNNESPT